MSLFMYCIIAVLIAFIMGRANRSIHLFWSLIIAFGIGAIGAAIFQKCTTSRSEKTNVVTVLTSENGLPASIPLLSEMTELDALDGPTATLQASQMSQATVSDYNAILLNCTSETSGEPRGQPFLQGFFDTS